MTRTIAVFLFLVALPVSSAAEPDKAEVVSKIIRLQHIHPDHAAELISPWGVSVNQSKALRAISVRGRAEDVTRVEEAVAELDQPDAYRSNKRAAEDEEASAVPSVEIRVHYLAVGAGEIGSEPTGRLAQVVEELRRSFDYEEYKLLDSHSVRTSLKIVGTEAHADVIMDGVFPSSANDPPLPIIYRLVADIRGLLGRAPNRVANVHQINATWRIPIVQDGNWQYTDIGLQTAIELPENKLVVLGKSGLKYVADGVFVVLEADVLD